VFDYYVNIAEVMIPHIAGRAVTRKRWPNGVDAPSFPIPDPSGRQRVPRADR
jgi:DNA primase